MEPLVLPPSTALQLMSGGWIVAALPVSNTMETVMMSYPITWIAAAVAFVLYYNYYMKKNGNTDG